MSNGRRRAARQLFTELANRLRAGDLSGIVDQSRVKLERLAGRVPETLASLWDDLKTMASLIAAYVNGSYREVPWRSLGAMAAGLLYFAMPLDAIPDFIPLSGYLDDAFILKLVIDLVAKDLEDYRRWRDGGIVIEHEHLT